MLQFIKSNALLVGGILVVILGLGYYLFSSSGTPAPLTTDSSSSSVSQHLLVTLSNLQTIQLNGAIFTDPAFQSLTNFGTTIPTQPTGRANPFAPFTSSAPAAPANTPAITLPSRSH
jgi:hypothetical protein